MPGTANNASGGWPGSRYRPARPPAIALRAAGGRGLVFDEVKGLNALCRGDRCDA